MGTALTIKNAYHLFELYATYHIALRMHVQVLLRYLV
jgi:hypothetical protein